MHSKNIAIIMHLYIQCIEYQYKSKKPHSQRENIVKLESQNIGAIDPVFTTDDHKLGIADFTFWVFIFTAKIKS